MHLKGGLVSRGRGLQYDMQTGSFKWFDEHAIGVENRIPTLSANTRKRPKSSSIVHWVTILRCSTRRIASRTSLILNE